MSNICAGIVLYNPSIKRLNKCLKAIYTQVEKVFMVDNGSENIESIRSIVTEYSKCFLIENSKNLGIACALNIICSRAFLAGYKWILTLDQDTLCPDNLISDMSKLLNKKGIGIICPAVYYEGLNIKKEDFRGQLPEISEVKACMTSASLTNLEAWEKVHGFRNDYFIDFVDNEFCMKLRLHGYKIIRVSKCIISHQLGDVGELNIFGKKIRYTRHSSWRYYYMIRNNRAFLWEYHKYLPMFKEFMKLWYILLYGLVTSKNKLKTLHYIVLGYKDGVLGCLGKLEIK